MTCLAGGIGHTHTHTWRCRGRAFERSGENRPSERSEIYGSAAYVVAAGSGGQCVCVRECVRASRGWCPPVRRAGIIITLKLIRNDCGRGDRYTYSPTPNLPQSHLACVCTVLWALSRVRNLRTRGACDRSGQSSVELGFAVLVRRIRIYQN